jgi:thiamine pyrophosphate-dependent acetolactate synthase large subunit-like protein
VPTNAEVVASTLARAGVEFTFGLPGGKIVALIQMMPHFPHQRLALTRVFGAICNCRPRRW